MIPLLFTVACAPEPVTGTVEMPTVKVDDVATVELDAVIPSDALPMPDGSILVLDGYAGRILRFDASGHPLGVWAEGGALGNPVRLTLAADGGVFAVDPGDDDVSGAILHLSADGHVDRAYLPTDADDAPLHPVDVLDLGDQLLVADRSKGLQWLSVADGHAMKGTRVGVDDEDLRRVVDLAALPGDRVAAVDTFSARIHAFGKDGANPTVFGRVGLSAGRLSRPKAIAVTSEGDLLIADSILGAVQVFEPDGDLVGVLATQAGETELSHPIAVRTAPDDPRRIVVVEARPARLRIFSLTGPIPPAPPPSLVRTELSPATDDVTGNDGETCLQCHDGLVRAGQEVWDARSGHHPIDIKPERVLPSVFPLDEEGKIQCGTCHSPHGVVSGEAARSTTAQLGTLIRHASNGSPFLRVAKEADELCVACHEEDAHAGGGTAVVSGGAGHKTGSALVEALKRRGPEEKSPTSSSCLSCHAMHGASGTKITRDPGEGATCLACHEGMGVSDRNHPLGRVPGKDLEKGNRGERLVLARGGGIGCLSCHDPVKGTGEALLRVIPRTSPICLDCHAERTDLKQGPHARLTKGGRPACLACHDVHGGDRDSHLLTIVSKATGADPDGCLTCHAPGASAAKAGVAPGTKGHVVDAQKLDDGSLLTCLSCHEPHSASTPTSKDCGACHKEQGAALAAGGHGRAACVDCHPAHETTRTFSNGKDNPAASRCLLCHAPGTRDDRAPKIEAWEHPAPTFLPDGTRWQPLEGIVLVDKAGEPLPAGQNGELSCVTCHTTHGPDAKGGDKLRKSGWKEACAACHGDDGLVLYRYYHFPERRADLHKEEEQ